MFYERQNGEKVRQNTKFLLFDWYQTFKILTYRSIIKPQYLNIEYKLFVPVQLYNNMHVVKRSTYLDWL